MSEAKRNLTLHEMTHEIAKKYGCDRAVFTACWGELEKGLVCKCKEEARAALTDAHEDAAKAILHLYDVFEMHADLEDWAAEIESQGLSDIASAVRAKGEPHD